MADRIRDFFSPEAGQRRRSWLNEVEGKAADAMRYYLGPDLFPPVNALASGVAMVSPGADVQDAYTASGELMQPDRSLLDRAASGAALAGSLGAMFMPGGVSSIRQGIDDLADAGVRAARSEDQLNAFTVWHGSPHDFDRFSLDKIGTGEGAQAYGHGLYFAEAPEVARGYRDQLSQMDTSAGKRALEAANGDLDAATAAVRSEIDRLNAMPNKGNDEDRWARQMAIQEAKLRELDNFRASGNWNTGRLYEVSIDAEPEDFLDWDATGMIGDMPAGPQRDVLERWARGFGRDPASTPSNQVMGLAKSPLASERLRQAGIPGIRYLDAGSRGAGDGSRNYVVFDDALTTIVGKDGQYTPAQQIARLLREGRAEEVTDDMLGALSPNDSMELMRLYEVGATGADMPMDTASRMARAEGMGFDAPVYHGGTSDISAISQFEGGAEGGQGVLFSSDEARVANTYAPRRAQPMGENVTPLIARSGEYREAGYTRPFPADGSDAEIENWLAGLDQFDRRMSQPGVKSSVFNQQIEAARANNQPGVVFRQVVDDRIDSGMALPSDVFATVDPTSVRSRFARFDPRLAHLSNLNAGVAGAAAIGVGALAMQPGQAEAQPAAVGNLLFQQEQAKRIRDYLGGVQ